MSFYISDRDEGNKFFFQGAFSIDLALLGFIDGNLKILLSQKDETSSEQYSLPGKFIFPNEDTEEVLKDLAFEILGHNKIYGKQLRAFSEVGRHPNGRVISIAHYGLVSTSINTVPKKSNLKWFNISNLPHLSYDHDRIFKVAMHKFRKGLLRHPTVFELLPEEFILSEIIAIYEQAFDRTIDKPNFRRHALKSGLLKETGEIRGVRNQMGRPPQIYTYDRNGTSPKKQQTINLGFT